MRTTSDIDDDLMRKLKERAHRSRKSFKKTLNDVIARGLSRTDAQGQEVPLPAWDMGLPMHPLDRAWELDAELEHETVRHELEKSS